MDRVRDKPNRLFLRALCINMQLTIGLRLLRSAVRHAQAVLALDLYGDPTQMYSDFSDDFPDDFPNE